MSHSSTAAAAQRLALELRFHALQPPRGARPSANPGPSSTASSAWTSLTASARRIAAWIARAQLQASRRRALMALDERTLKDIGIDRSEIESVLAERAGLAESTRRCLMASQS